MDNRLYEVLSETFAHRGIIAEEDADDDIQRRLYGDVFRKLLEFVPPDDWIGKYIDQVITDLGTYGSQSRREAVDRVDFAALEKSDADAFAVRFRRLMKGPVADNLPYLYGAAAAIAVEARYLLGEPRSSPFMNAAELATEAVSYLQWRHAEAIRDIHGLQIENAIAEFRGHGSAVLTEMKSALQEASKLVIELQNNREGATRVLEEMRVRSDQAVSTLQNKIHVSDGALKKLEEETTGANAELQAVKEGLRTLSAKKLWDKRAKTSNFAFWASAVLLVVMLLIVPAFALYNLDDVLLALRHISDAATQTDAGIPGPTQLAVATISRLVVITVPLALYIWVIRLVVRFNMRSLALHDDAQQRHTMMDTYFHLIEHQAASKEDRALILNALFRPIPGHGAENIDPPNFTELVKGMERAN